jgi:hypothetical protein
VRSGAFAVHGRKPAGAGLASLLAAQHTLRATAAAAAAASFGPGSADELDAAAAAAGALREDPATSRVGAWLARELRLGPGGGQPLAQAARRALDAEVELRSVACVAQVGGAGFVAHTCPRVARDKWGGEGTGPAFVLRRGRL